MKKTPNLDLDHSAQSKSGNLLTLIYLQRGVNLFKCILFLMLLNLKPLPVMAQFPFEVKLASTGSIEMCTNVTHTESDALKHVGLGLKFNASARDGDDPKFFWEVLDNSNIVKNNLTENLPSDAIHGDVALTYDGNDVYIIVVYSQISTNGITLEYYKLDNSNPAIPFFDLCNTETVITGDLVANTINIDADNLGNFLVTADIFIDANTSSLSALILIPGNTSIGSSCPGVNSECITYVRPSDEENNLSWPDVSLSYCFFYGGPSQFVDNVSAIITYQVGNNTNGYHVEVITAPDYPCFEFLKEEQIYGVAALTATPYYYWSEPFYRYYVLSDAPTNGDPVNGFSMYHPRATSWVTNDASWQVACEVFDNTYPRNDIFLFCENATFPEQFDAKSLTGPSTPLYASSAILDFDCFYPQICKDMESENSNVIFDVVDNISQTDYYSIAAHMNGIFTALQFDGMNSISPYNFSHFDENSTFQLGSSVGGRFNSYMYYSCFDFHSNEWQFKNPPVDLFRLSEINLQNNQFENTKLKTLHSPLFIGSLAVLDNTKLNYAVSDVSGRIIYEGVAESDEMQTHFDNWGLNLRKGTYLVKLISEGSPVHAKLIKY